jgi:hypothetical protein
MSGASVVAATLLAGTLAGCTSDAGCDPSSDSGCADGGPSATVHVVLKVVGGPPGPAQPIPGTVSLVGESTSYSVSIDKSGEGTIAVVPGVYLATGTGPMFSNTPDVCSADRRLDAREDRTVTVHVTCDIR